MKKLFGILLSSTLVLTLLINAHAATTTRRSDYGYLSSYYYYATSMFNDSTVIRGTYNMKSNGGTITNLEPRYSTNSVRVYADISVPSNYNTPIDRTVYHTSPEI